MSRTNKNYENCIAGQLAKTVSSEDKHLPADELYKKLKQEQSNNFTRSDDTHLSLEFKDGSQIKAIYLDAAFERGTHPTPSDVTVWDGTLK